MDEFLSQLTDDELLALYGEIDQETKNHSFCLFSCYNARDVEVLVKLDVKFKLMQLVNQMAHENTVPFEAILGTVRYVETGITNRAKNVHKKVVTDKVQILEENEKVEGAIVMTPRAGLWEWLGSVDITSLYPSVIRALNMSIETFFGQFNDGENAWAGIREKDLNLWTLVLADGEEVPMTGAQWHAWIRENNYALSAIGTVFDQSKPGMVADTLTYWFNERKRLQAEKKKYSKLAKEEKDPVLKAEYERTAEHFDLLQLTKKIQLNSCYGALLNEAFRFGRREIGGSVTGTGRQISKYMGETIGTVITGLACELEKRYGRNKTDGGEFYEGHEFSELVRQGRYDVLRDLPAQVQYEAKFDKDANKMIMVPTPAIWFTECPAIIYGDTDSCYFLTYGTSYEDAVAKADDIAKRTNDTFPTFMAEAFNCTGGRELLIKAAREVVAERGIFMTAKKKYTLKVVNLDGADLREKPKLKSMGSEIKKADTPKVVQEFLKGLMDLVLGGKEYPEIEQFVNSHRGKLIHRNEDLIALGTAKQINNLDAFYAAWIRGGKKDGKVMTKNKNGQVVPTNVPGHVKAAMNYNELIAIYDEGTTKPLKSGDKGVVFYLKPNEYGFKTLAFPADMQHLPKWFDEHFKVDLEITEEKMIDAKIEGIFDALGHDVPTMQRSFLNSIFTF